jgi:hypothetical protein
MAIDSRSNLDAETFSSITLPTPSVKGTLYPKPWSRQEFEGHEAQLQHHRNSCSTPLASADSFKTWCLYMADRTLFPLHQLSDEIADGDDRARLRPQLSLAKTPAQDQEMLPSKLEAGELEKSKRRAFVLTLAACP